MNKQKGLAPVLIVILIAAIIGGFLVYQKQTKITSISQPSPVPTAKSESSSSAEIANPDLIGANWKIYQNNKWGISFNYPTDYEIEKEDDKEISFSGLYGENQRVSKELVITKTLTNLNQTKDCKEAVDTATNPCVSDKKEIVISNKRAVSFGLDYAGGGFNSSSRIQFTEEPKIEIYAVIYGGGGSARFDKILSTFRSLP